MESHLAQRRMAAEQSKDDLTAVLEETWRRGARIKVTVETDGWNDIVTFIETQKKEWYIQLLDTAIEDMYRLQGALKALETVLKSIEGFIKEGESAKIELTNLKKVDN